MMPLEAFAVICAQDLVLLGTPIWPFQCGQTALLACLIGFVIDLIVLTGILYIWYCVVRKKKDKDWRCIHDFSLGNSCRTVWNLFIS